MWFLVCFFFSPGRSAKGMAYVLPGQRHCWINHDIFLANGTLLNVLYKWRLFSSKERCFSSEQHKRHAGSSCSEACEQLRFVSGNTAQIALQVSSVADGLTETPCKEVTVPFGGIAKPSNRHIWKLNSPVLICSPCILVPGSWAFCFLWPCQPRAFLFPGTAAEQYPHKLQKHPLTCRELCLEQQPGSLPKRTAISRLSL